jgi:hypothetical protein
MTTLLAALSFVVLIATLADVFTTLAALVLPGVYEANPLILSFMRLLGPAWVIPRILLALGIVAAALSVPGWPAVGLLVFAIAITAYAAVHNFRLVMGA